MCCNFARLTQNTYGPINKHSINFHRRRGRIKTRAQCARGPGTATKRHAGPACEALRGGCCCVTGQRSAGTAGSSRGSQAGAAVDDPVTPRMRGGGGSVVCLLAGVGGACFIRTYPKAGSWKLDFSRVLQSKQKKKDGGAERDEGGPRGGKAVLRRPTRAPA